MTIKSIHIFDIDGVLIDSSHRYRIKEDFKIDLDHWLDNCTEAQIEKDSLLPMANLYKKLMRNPSTYVIIATARQMIDLDFSSIKKLLGMPNHIIYRKAGDYQSGTTLKLNGLNKLLNLKQFKNARRHFYEDNQDYLYPVAKAIGATPQYVHSSQGF